MWLRLLFVFKHILKSGAWLTQEKTCCGFFFYVDFIQQLLCDINVQRKSLSAEDKEKGIAARLVVYA